MSLTSAQRPEPLAVTSNGWMDVRPRADYGIYGRYMEVGTWRGIYMEVHGGTWDRMGLYVHYVLRVKKNLCVCVFVLHAHKTRYWIVCGSIGFRGSDSSPEFR